MPDSQIVLFTDDEDDLKALAIKSGLTPVEEDEQLEGLDLDPLTMALLVGAGIAIGKFILSVLERKKGGVRIDLGTIPPSVSRSKDVPFGMIVIFTVDNDVRIETKDEPTDALERMVSDVIKLPVNATTDIVKETLKAAKG